MYVLVAWLLPAVSYDKRMLRWLGLQHRSMQLLLSLLLIILRMILSH